MVASAAKVRPSCTVENPPWIAVGAEPSAAGRAVPTLRLCDQTRQGMTTLFAGATWPQVVSRDQPTITREDDDRSQPDDYGQTCGGLAKPPY